MIGTYASPNLRNSQHITKEKSVPEVRRRCLSQCSEDSNDVAAQTTIAPAAYSVRVEPCPERPARTQRAALDSNHSVEQALSPARGRASSLEAVEKATIAIIPEVNWAELSDEALIANYRNTGDRALAEEYANELFRRHHVKIARWCLGFTGDRESAADLAQEICVKAYRNLAN